MAVAALPEGRGRYREPEPGWGQYRVMRGGAHRWETSYNCVSEIQIWLARPELDINLNPGDPSH